MAAATNAEILLQLRAVSVEVKEIAVLGQANFNELKMLRRELGLDGQHGRLPIMETTLIRHEAHMEKCDARIDKLEMNSSEANGKAKLVATSLALLGGGAGGALIALLAHLIGVH
jgi:hypothetical protein